MHKGSVQKDILPIDLALPFGFSSPNELKICDVSMEFLFLILTWKDRKVEAKFPHLVLQE